MTLSKETQYKVQISKRTYRTPLETVFMKNIKTNRQIINRDKRGRSLSASHLVLFKHGTKKKA